MRRFEAQRRRGTESFGFYKPSVDRLTHNVKESRIKALLKNGTEGNEEVLFHHRLATSTGLVRNACHPFSTKDKFENQYIVVHNGVVRNAKELKVEHDKLGITYASMQPNLAFNDSEALAYDLARYFEGDVDKLTAAGTIAFIAIKRNKQGKPVTLFFGRNTGNPLVMKKTENSLTLSSEGEGDPIDPNKLYIYDYETGNLRTRSMIIPVSSWSGYSGYGGGYSGNYNTREWDSFGKKWVDKKPAGFAARATDNSELAEVLKSPSYGDEDYVKWWDKKQKEEKAMGVLDGDSEELVKHFIETNHNSVNRGMTACMAELLETRQYIKKLEEEESELLDLGTDDEMRTKIERLYIEALQYESRLDDALDGLEKLKKVNDKLEDAGIKRSATKQIGEVLDGKRKPRK